ncbi:hypothetical protein RF55_19230, partial [Lasius niger]
RRGVSTVSVGVAVTCRGASCRYGVVPVHVVVVATATAAVVSVVAAAVVALHSAAVVVLHVVYVAVAAAAAAAVVVVAVVVVAVVVVVVVSVATAIAIVNVFIFKLLSVIAARWCRVCEEQTLARFVVVVIPVNRVVAVAI